MANALIAVAQNAARAAFLDPELVCAVVEQESAWNPWASRFEPGFYDEYIAPRFTTRTTESISQATSYGLMQVMGATARELGFTEATLTSLCDPETGLLFGCKELKACLAKENGNVTAALLRFNGGADKTYPAQVLARKGRYASDI